MDNNIRKLIKYLWNRKLRACFLLFMCYIITRMIQTVGCQKDDDNWTKPIESSGEHEPAFSPDGEFVTYVREPDNDIPDYQIWLFEMATEESEYFTDGFSPDWSPDGKEIVYVYNRNIYKISVETKETKQLTTWGSCFSPDWSPNGKRIAFDTNHDDPTGANVIWLMDSNGTNCKDISIHGTGEWREPDWSPSEDRLVHIRYVGVGAPEIFIMDSSGQNSVRLTNNQTDDSSPAWSPDGSKIAYLCVTRDTVYPQEVIGFNIWVMDTSGNNKIQLTDFGRESKSGALDPAWSPDGKQIVYVQSESIEKKTEIECFYHLWIMDADGENKEQLTGEVTKTFGCK